MFGGPSDIANRAATEAGLPALITDSVSIMLHSAPQLVNLGPVNCRNPNNEGRLAVLDSMLADQDAKCLAGKIVQQAPGSRTTLQKPPAASAGLPRLAKA